MLIPHLLTNLVFMKFLSLSVVMWLRCFVLQLTFSSHSIQQVSILYLYNDVYIHHLYASLCSYMHSAILWLVWPMKVLLQSHDIWDSLTGLQKEATIMWSEWLEIWYLFLPFSSINKIWIWWRNSVKISCFRMVYKMFFWKEDVIRNLYEQRL